MHPLYVTTSRLILMVYEPVLILHPNTIYIKRNILPAVDQDIVDGMIIFTGKLALTICTIDVYGLDARG